MANAKNKTNQLSSQLIASLSFEDSNKQLQALKEMIFNEPLINDSKIQFIKEELATDRYEVNSYRIAVRLMEDIQTIKNRTPAEEEEA
ncbi:flagellar biosynthesis anti-sigma factor FlgM (plasmid) [Legionella adelaidensis]|uniref:Flagellar biosynthesis anti-sigma factor FlgM n=1 Tax=Legionella adelaidensis TaxID=45056 RepID=A0A0W0R420_9GAMM|nr:flagellar biosynthesis anti-sigma factor FlgM [Legionella adelaidensis]KTC65797.1 hypothetical protein Lade_0455 [Legionella adelaidensis]VEH85225.1 flagellar biosynthesis anti-sigma factor FlgM [Legionella adelaidensis]